jgi:outer membrane protein assembly factor BamA
LRKYLIYICILLPGVLTAQQDTTKRITPGEDSVHEMPLLKDSIAQKITDNPHYIDSLNLVVKDVVISGNKITKDEIILREMNLKPGSKFTLKNYEHDVNSIYNLGLFMKVDIIPLPATGKYVVLNVDVQERWYFFPLPSGGIEGGDWKKIWLGLNLRWENFRGRNEVIGLSFRVFYNPSINFHYSIPWIGKNLHLFTSINVGFSRIRNQSLEALGKPPGSESIGTDEANFDNNRFNGMLTVGKFIKDRFSVFTDIGYNYLRVTQNAPGRTLSPTGKDKYITLGLGVQYDTRNILEYTTAGFYIKTGIKKFGFVDSDVNYSRFQLDSRVFIPVNITREYFITLGTRLYSSIAVGGTVPIYNHEYLGYSEQYVRGWQSYTYEGENALTMFNEIRIPIIKPRYIKAEKIPLLKYVPIINRMDLKHGLFFTVFYDVGAVYEKNQMLRDVKFRSGTGIGLNFILPFGYILRTEWGFRLGNPIVGKFGLGLEAKF